MSNLRRVSATLVICSALLLLLAFCNPGSSIRTDQVDVFHATGGGPLNAVALATTETLLNGDRVSTSDSGIGDLTVPCAEFKIYGGSALQFQEISANGANLGVAVGATEISTICPNITVTLGEATITTSGTVFLAAYNPDLRQAFLWTQVGKAVLAARTGQRVQVSAGSWSVVRAGAQPIAPQPVGAMGGVINTMGLGGVYNRVVTLVQTQGFGPGARTPLNIATIGRPAPPPPTPTPLR
jgi:hypothetical protein